MKANHLDLVQQEHARQPPTSGDLLSVFRFEQRVLARLAREFPGEQWGYLKKGGDNTIQYGAGEIKVGRVCGPDSQLYKIATDIPTVNAPVWNDDGILTNDFPGSKPEAWWLPYDGAAEPGTGVDIIPTPAPPAPPATVAQGPVGPQGPPGPKGDKGDAGASVDVAAILNRLSALESEVKVLKARKVPTGVKAAVKVFGNTIPIAAELTYGQ